MKMKLTLKPVETPFRVGETVFVNMAYSILATNELGEQATDQGYFEAVIIRIFLEGLRPLTIVSEPKDEHVLVITNLIYDLKPLGKHKGSNRVALNVNVDSKSLLLFADEKGLLNYNGEAAKKGVIQK